MKLTETNPEKVCLVDVVKPEGGIVHNVVIFGSPTADSIGFHLGDIYEKDGKFIYRQINNYPAPHIDAKVLGKIKERIESYERK